MLSLAHWYKRKTELHSFHTSLQIFKTFSLLFTLFFFAKGTTLSAGVRWSTEQVVPGQTSNYQQGALFDTERDLPLIFVTVGFRGGNRTSFFNICLSFKQFILLVTTDSCVLFFHLAPKHINLRVSYAITTSK